MTTETLEDIVKAFNADKRLHQHLEVGQIEIDQINIGIPTAESTELSPKYDFLLYFEDGFNLLSACAIEHIEYFTFKVETEGLTGEVTIQMNSNNRTVRCDTDKLVVKEEFASQGYVLAGMSLKWAALGGDYRLLNRAERRKKKKLTRH